MTPDDFWVYVPQDERESFLKKLVGYRVGVEEESEDNLWLQGHPGMSDILKDNFTYSFTQCIGGSSRDLIIDYSCDDGEWTEDLECDEHWNGDGHRSISVDEFNEIIENLHDEDWVYSPR